MPAVPSDLDIFDASLIKPTYSGDCIPPWLLKSSSSRRNVLSNGGSLEISLKSSIRPKDFFPDGHEPLSLPSYLSFFSRSDSNQLQRRSSGNDHHWSRYVKSYSQSLAPDVKSILHQDHDHTSFSSWFPPPYRVLLLLSLGVLAFAFDLNLLERLGMSPWPMKQHPPISQANDQDKDKVEMASNSTSTDSESPSSLDHSSESESGTHYSQIYFLGFLCLIWSLAGWFTFRFYVDGPLHGDPYGRHAQTLQGISVLGAVAATIWPGDLLCKEARWGFGRALRRILSPSLSQEVTFSDIVLADILTSYAKVLGDVWLTLCFLLPRAEHHTWWSGKGSIAVPIITSLPYLVRLRQCLSEYSTSSPIIQIEDQGRGKGREKILRRSRRPLANAVKYASAFPVIWLSAWQGVKEERETGEEALALQFWLLSVFINSLFSFWWDVTNDWGLDLLRWHTWASTPSKVAEGVRSLHKRGAISVSLLRGSSNSNPATKTWRHSSLTGSRPLTRPIETIDEEDRPFDEAIEGSTRLRPPEKLISRSQIDPPEALSETPRALVPLHSRSRSSFLLRSESSGHTLAFSPTVYQAAVVLDLLLRFAWSLKLSSHLHHIVELEVGVFVLEALEIIRRSAWAFFRVEWEYVKKARRKTEAFVERGVKDGKVLELELQKLRE